MTALVLVIDSFGIGAAPDAGSYGDQGSATAQHIAQKVGRPRWPQLERLGLGHAACLTPVPLPGMDLAQIPSADYGVLIPRSPGKDTTTGHWELMGLTLDAPFPVFPPGPPSFLEALVAQLKQATGYEFIGNCAASGTQIIQDLGDEHRATGRPILYTSADSVLQIAAHEEIIPPQDLYSLCETARRIANGYRIGRIIARPFSGTSGHYERTSGRHDYSFPLPGPSTLDRLADRGIQTIGVGKIGDIYNHQGLTQSYPEKGNPACLAKTLELLRTPCLESRLILVNLVDTDMVWGHRRDPQGYHDCVAQTDEVLGDILGLLGDEDHLFITADHGCDPTFPGTDHTREMVPLLHGHKKNPGRNLGLLEGFHHLGVLLEGIFP